VSEAAAKELFFLGIDCLDQENFKEAETHLKNSLDLLPSRKSTLVNLSIACLRQDKLDEAYKYASEATLLEPRDPNVLNQLSVVLIEMERSQEALEKLDEILIANPNDVDALVNKGKALLEIGRFSEAVNSFDVALSKDRTVIEAYIGIGNSLRRLNKPNEALDIFNKAISMHPNNPILLNSIAVLLQYFKRYEEALSSYDKAISYKLDYAEAFNNRGVVLQDLKRFDEAFVSYDKAIDLKPGSARAHFNKGTSLQALNDFVGAFFSYKNAFSIDPDLPFLRGSLIDAKMQVCDWANFYDEVRLLGNDVAGGKCVVQPFSFLALIDSPSGHLKCAQAYAKKQDFAVASVAFLVRGSKIRIGYVSADFRNHPMPQVIRELIERHDRDQFTVCGFSLFPDDGSILRAKIKASFDEFYDCHSLDDERVRDLIREKKIDILIDLNGYTAHCRTQIFAGRPAPIQVSYIGYVGTMAISFIDYIIGDKVVFPESADDFYTEKLVRLPHSYYSRDRSLEPSSVPQRRRDHSLPDSEFVFCCFNGAYKILPSVFDSWMRILKSVDGSVLWLLEANPVAKKNLQLEAEARGVSPERLVFAPKKSLPDHLARHRCADLFLDTLPYNAHTTASDALWAGLPVLTHCGEAFAGRVAASLLNAVGLPELITHSEAEYETTAIRLAKDPNELAALRQRLEQNKRSSKLFDTPLYIKHLEAAFEEMYERYHSGLPPEHIYVKD